ncbi:MAG: sulfopropanediol 3-dehydrogenase [Solirubrobacteraceae bacterium]|jgi:sulfopropanediol 3-dehydrogenase|nr:sulfopropanediol 3-dehydrogenase [Solirubrobacteraceae bacterium]
MAEQLKRAERPGPAVSPRIRSDVSEMLLRIESRGEAAVREYSRVLDRWDPPSFLVEPAACAAAAEAVDEALAGHIAFAQEQVRGFARAQRGALLDLEVEQLPGVVLGHRHMPVGAVGAYVPGGRYPMLASAFMTVLVAKEAGVGTVVACAPPRDARGIPAPMLHAIASSGADAVLCLGGVQGLATLAFGLCGVEPVDMLVGAGNAYVAEAKRQLFGRVGIDLLAGPTEVLVLAEAGADPELVAADLLGQAEHGPTSEAVLVTTSRALADDVLERIPALIAGWSTAEVAAEAWRDRGEVVLVADRAEAVRVADERAPEHLEVHAADPGPYLDALRNYGSLFLGEHATVAYGDKAVGTNHVLPTGRAARYTGGLWIGKFLKTVTYQRLTAEGSARVAPAVAAIAHAEGFAGHAATAELRLRRLTAEARR